MSWAEQTGRTDAGRVRDDETSPIIGRRRLLDDVLAGLRSGNPGALLVGEMGVGKTRVLTEVVTALESDGWMTQRAVTSASTSSIPFGALSELLPRLPTPDLRLVLETVRHHLADQARGRPLLLVVDDAHHLDDPSAALVHQMVVTRAARALVTHRSGGGVSETITTLWKDGHLVRTSVPPLSRTAHDALAETMLGARAGPTLAAQLWHRTEGNPLFLRELVLSALHTGAVVRRGDAWVLARDIELPERLVEIVETRMTRLEPAARRTLEAVAVGEPLSLGVAAQVVGLDALESLERTGLVRTVVEEAGPTVRTAHPLHGEALRVSMPAATAARIRRDLARELGRTTPLSAPDLIRAVAWTLQAGERPDVELTVRAAGAALARSDPALAERFTRAALDADTDHPGATRLLGAALSAQGVREPATDLLHRAFERSHVEGDRVDSALALSRHLLWMLRDLPSADESLRTAIDAVRSDGGRAELRAEQAIIMAVAGDLPGTIRLAQEVLDAPEASSRAVLTALIQSTLARCMLGHHDGLDDDLQRGRHLAADLADEEPLAVTQLEVTRLMYRHYVDIDEAAHDARAGHEAADLDGRPAGLLSATAAWMQLDRGAAPEVANLARRALVEAERFDPFNMRPMTHCLLSISLGMGGQASAARAALTAVGGPETLEPRTRTWFDRATAWATAAAGRIEEAAHLAHQSGRRAIDAGLRTWGASVLFDAVRLGHAEVVADALRELAAETPPPLVHGFFLSATGCVDREPEQLLVAADLLARTGALVPAATTLECAAALLRDSRAQEAERLHLRAWVLRDHCRAHGEPRRLRPRLTMTSREIEIARQAASGRTSRGIATDLGLSPRTVDNHLASTYRKLGISSRVELGHVVPEAFLSTRARPSE